MGGFGIHGNYTTSAHGSSNGQAHQVSPLAIGPAPDAMQYGLCSLSHEFYCVEQ